MRITVTLAAVLYTLGTSMAWALDDTPTLAPRFIPRPEDGRAVGRGVLVIAAPLASSAMASVSRPVAGDNDMLSGNVRGTPLRTQAQPLPLTRVLPANSHGAGVKSPAKPL